ncbi:hypothetical protein OQI_26080 [Streptomyces pharetrae CZA14]|uniref:Uncharacterized protein n=1 Tax=Streptomyces pharetrae CZA14 TaxID=1144883 RepID=A0ABX3YD49_9ACTN|nr:hypothetical protein OQI_26080 [Streptomyces pharetrae CZA14]
MALMPPAGRPCVLRIRERAAAGPRPSLSSGCADLEPCSRRRDRADGLAKVQVAAQPHAGLAGVPRRRLRCRRCPPVGEQLLEGERGGVVGGRDVDDDQVVVAVGGAKASSWP